MSLRIEKIQKILDARNLSFTRDNWMHGVAGIYLASKQCEWNVFGSTRVAYSDEIKFNIVYSGSRCYSKCVLIDSNKIIRFIRIYLTEYYPM